MSPILDLQKRAKQIGRIRIGRQVPTGKVRDGRPVMRPAKLGTFRFTSASEHAARAIADLLGGTVQPWTDAPTAGQWEVITEVDSLPVNVPPGPPEQTVSQWYELWTDGGCVRRCDGQTETISGDQCQCPTDQMRRADLAKEGRACRVTTRINVLVPDLPGLGVWMLESHGYYAAVELGGVAEVLAQASDRGLMVPALLRIEQRQVRRPGQKPKQFPVPALDVLPTMREITHAVASGGGLAQALPPPPKPLVAIEAGPTPSSPSSRPVGEPSREQAAQGFHDAAAAAQTVEDLQAVWRSAHSAGVIDELVKPVDSDALEPLSEALQRYAADLDGEGATDA